WAGQVGGRGDERIGGGRVRPPGSGLRRLPLVDRYAQEDGAYLEERAFCRRSRLGRRRAVSSGDCRKGDSRFVKKLLPAILFACLSLSATQAQDGQTPTISVNVRLVNVFANVTDEQGSPIPGLNKDDF